MRRGAGYLFLLWAAVFLTGCRSRVRLIPRDRMAAVYAELFLADQWVYDRNFRGKADSVAVYEPILSEYGYTVEDFRYSVDRYMNDAERFSKVLEASKRLLQIRLKQVGEKIKLEEKWERAGKEVERRKESFRWYGALGGAEKDSLFRLLFHLPADSLKQADFPAPLERRADTLKTAADSLRQAADSLKSVTDTLKPMTDTLKPMTDTLKPMRDRLKPLARKLKPVTDRSKPAAGVLRPGRVSGDVRNGGPAERRKGFPERTERRPGRTADGIPGTDPHRVLDKTEEGG